MNERGLNNDNRKLSVLLQTFWKAQSVGRRVWKKGIYSTITKRRGTCLAPSGNIIHEHIWGQ